MMMLKKIVFLLLLSATHACATVPTLKQAHCASHLNSPIENFCEVIPNVLWRGAKPTQETAEWLLKIGVKTIINLELIHDDAEILKKIPSAKKIDYFRVQTWEPFYALAHGRADEDVIRFLAIAKQAKLPIYVHCRAGENRTGVMVAAYKIILKGQHSPAQVNTIIKEMQSYDGFWSDSTTAYIKDLARRHEDILKKVQAYTVASPIHF